MKRLSSLVALVFVLAGASSAQAATCTKVASPGADLRSFASSLKSGDIGCLHAGTYGSPGTWASMAEDGTASKRITLMGYPGEPKPPIIRGQLGLVGDYITVSGLIFDGPAGKDPGNGYEMAPIAVWGGDHVEINRSVVRGSKSREGIAITDEAQDVRLIGNHIHDNGDFGNPDQANFDHGIYFVSGSGLIANNIIEHNYAFGVHLYPSAHDVLVTHNTIVRNGRAGVIIAGEPGAPVPTRNRVVNNIVASNAENAVTSWGALGPGNIVHNNIFWSNGTGGSTAGLTMTGNLTQDPLFVGGGNHRLRPGSPAVDAAVGTFTQPYDAAGTRRPQGRASDIGAYELRARNTLSPGQTLEAGEALTPSNFGFRLHMQTDGNLVLYTWEGRALWHSRTYGNPGARAVMQTDGNFVVYSRTNHALFNTVTYGNPAARLVLQDDGNLVVYSATDRPLWDSYGYVR